MDTTKPRRWRRWIGRIPAGGAPVTVQELAEPYARAIDALLQSEYAEASIPARTSYLIGFMNGSEGRDQRADLETTAELVAFEAGMAAGLAAREPALEAGD